jgi:hypothetical protein
VPDDAGPGTGNGGYQGRRAKPAAPAAEPPTWARDLSAGRGGGTGQQDYATGPGPYSPDDFNTNDFAPNDFATGPGDFAADLGDFPAGLGDFPGDQHDFPGGPGFPGQDGYPGGPDDYPGGPGDFTGSAPTEAYQPHGPGRPGQGRPGQGGPGPARPGQGRRGRGRRVLVAGSALAVLLLAAVLYIVLGHSPKSAPPPAATGSHSPSPAPTTSGNNQLTNVFSLTAGQCFQNPPASQTVLGITYVAVVSCTTPHNAQVFVQFSAKGTSYPGSAALKQQSDTGCHKAISKNVKKSRIKNSMTLRYLYPLASAWAQGHRTITCLIVDTKPDIKQSLLRTSAGH